MEENKMTGLEIGLLGLGGAGLIGNIWNAFQSKKTSDKNYDMQKDLLNYQKYLNNNQIQMQTADALKAGINPIALGNPGSLQSGNYSNVQAPVMDTSGLTQLASTAMQNANARKIAETQAKSAENVANINAQSQERQTQMKIDADTEAQKTQNIWQETENFKQRFFESMEKKMDRQSAEKIADKTTQTMRDVAEINDKLQRWINTYQPLIQGNGKDMAIDGDENGKINILSAQQYTVQKQVEEMITRGMIEGNYKAQLLNLQNELKDLQKKATDAGVNTSYINALGNIIGNIGSIIKPY